MFGDADYSALSPSFSFALVRRFASRSELIPFFYRMGVTYLVTGAYNIDKIKAVVERLNLEEDIQPAFDKDLYNKIMTTYSGTELSDIVNSL